MRCPYCGSEDTQVKDSRPAEDNTSIRGGVSVPIAAAASPRSNVCSCAS